jgi:hypothetical protein
VDFSSSTKPLTFNENFERQTKDLSLEETGRYVMGRFEADDRMRELSGSVEITEPFFKKIIENLSSENFGLFMKALFLNTGKDMLGLEKFLNQELQKLEDQYGNNKLTMAFVRQLTRAFPDPSRSLSESLGSDDGKASGSSSQSLDLS